MGRLAASLGRLRASVRPRRVVYTCSSGYSEHFNDFVYERDGIDFVCFTDDPELRSDFWTINPMSRGLLDPARAAKQIKALPHRFLPEYDWSLYIENTVRLKTSPKRLFDEFLARVRSSFVCFRHGSLTPAEVPLIEAEKLFRQPSPALLPELVAASSLAAKAEGPKREPQKVSGCRVLPRETAAGQRWVHRCGGLVDSRLSGDTWPRSIRSMSPTRPWG
jgi:hypothetical protein